MELDYTCIGKPDMEPPGRWKGRIRLFKDTDPYELEATARYSSFHILCGKHKYGNYMIWVSKAQLILSTKNEP